MCSGSNKSSISALSLAVMLICPSTISSHGPQSAAGSLQSPPGRTDCAATSDGRCDGCSRPASHQQAAHRPRAAPQHQHHLRPIFHKPLRLVHKNQKYERPPMHFGIFPPPALLPFGSGSYPSYHRFYREEVRDYSADQPATIPLQNWVQF